MSWLIGLSPHNLLCFPTTSDFYSAEKLGLISCNAAAAFKDSAVLFSKNEIYLESLFGRKPQQCCISDEKLFFWILQKNLSLFQFTIWSGEIFSLKDSDLKEKIQFVKVLYCQPMYIVHLHIYKYTQMCTGYYPVGRFEQQKICSTCFDKNTIDDLFR